MSRVHKLRNLKSAEFVATGPFTAEPKLKGKALEGIRYQKQVHAQVTTLSGNPVADQWIKFIDSTGLHWCRPDSILDNWDRVVVFESKLSLRQLDKGLAQLKLYRPILEFIFGKPVVGVIAFRHWSIGTDDCLPMIEHPEEILCSSPRRLMKPLGWNYM